MCMNCGCGEPNEDHGNPANITLTDLRGAGDANGQSLRESAQHILEAVDLPGASNSKEPATVAAPGQPGAGAERGTPATES